MKQFLIFIVIFFIGCAENKDQNILKVGSENAYKPFAYLDDKNIPSGFDNEAIGIVAEFMENKPEISFNPTAWNAIFSALDGGKFDVIANQITKNKDREEKYLFSSKPYFYGISALIVGDGVVATTLNDLNGEKVGVTVGSNHANNLENYLKQNPNLKIEIAYYKTSPTLVGDLASGRIKAMINDPIAAQDYAKNQGAKIIATNFILEKSPVYFIFRKDSIELKNKVDSALEKALKAGKIDELIIKYFGADYLILTKGENK